MKNKKSLVALAAIILIAIIGVTFAYFQTTGSFVNIFGTGTYRVVTTEVFEGPENWAPGEEIPKTITSTNEGTIPAAVRISYTEKWFDGDTEITNNVSAGTAIINFDNTEDWELVDGYYYYKHILNSGETTTSFIKSVTLDPNINGAACVASQDGLSQVCKATNPALGATYKLILRIETIQSDKIDEWNSEVEIDDGGNNGNNNNGETTSCTPKYFAFGNPTTSSTTNYLSLEKDVMGALCEDGTKGVCIIKNGNLECFMGGNYDYEKSHLRNLYPNISCTGNTPLCSEDQYGFTIKDDYSCTIQKDDDIGCGILYSNHRTVLCRIENGVIECEDYISEH